MPKHFIQYRYVKVTANSFSIEDAVKMEHLFSVPTRQDAEKAVSDLNNIKDLSAITILKATLSSIATAAKDQTVGDRAFRLIVEKEALAALHQASKVGRSA